MKILKTMICAALLVAGLSGCEKFDVNKLEGTWYEQYDPTVFAMDGSVTYTFDGNGHYQLHVYALASSTISRDFLQSSVISSHRLLSMSSAVTI